MLRHRGDRFLAVFSSYSHTIRLGFVCACLPVGRDYAGVNPSTSLMFDPVNPRQSFPELERGILQYWKEEAIFHRSLEQRESGERFSFYDGPPFATGLPHYGHLLAGTIKDVIPRYQTMRGKYVERRFGWDCHGLPVENLIEKEKGLKSKKEIDEMGIAAFNQLCRDSVQRYTKEWRATVERIGRFVDMDWDYRTMDPDYMESIFWVFSQLAEKGLLYEGHKPMHLCPHCVTPLSNFEVTQGYKDVTDQSATVKFELVDEPGTYVLAWTTTPWTLPGNLFLAIGPDIKYVRVSVDGNTYIVAEERVEDLFKKVEHTVGKTVTHKELLGKHYRPLFPYFVDRYPTAFRVVLGDFVTTGEGTGIVHIAPGFGEDDYNVGKREDVPLLQHVTMEGKFIPDVTDFAGMDVKPKDDPTKTDQKVMAWLDEKGLLFERIAYKHSYPHCWRCDSPLLNYATSSWFVAVEKIKRDMLEANAKTEWVPSHLRDGRFGKWLEGARDWAISRNRYWGTPLPLWRTSKDDTAPVVISSRDDLMLNSKIRFTKITTLRHAESEGNVKPVYQGKLPGTDLTKKGKQQATETGKKLASDRLPVDIIYCSPLARTLQTAQLVAKETGAEVIVDDRLRELDFGEYEGTTINFSDLALLKARRAHKIEKNQVESIYHFPGMEDWDSTQKRIRDFMNDILPKHRSQHVVVVTHADPVQNIRHFFSKEDPLKLSHQPYPYHAVPYTFYWDHDREAQVDLHKEFLDTVVWPGGWQEGKSVKLTIARHGETDWNAGNKVQGNKKDISLNEKGRSQAQTLAESLNPKEYDIVISSDLDRGIETAKIIAEKTGLPYDEQWDILQERKLGSWIGKEKAAYQKHHGLDAGVQPSVSHVSPEGGESFSAFMGRAQQTYQMLLDRFPGKRVLMIGHGGFIRAMEAFITNMNYWELATGDMKNAEVKTFDINPLYKRIPEVLDCWFESGSMPYAQVHHPFSSPNQSQNSTPPNFPADFIAEGIDQTRGWFYTLTVLGAALFKSPVFKHCITNGTILAEDGRKMSKKLQNYPDPNLVMDEMGADALRFSLMSSQAVRGEDMRFSQKVVEDSVRNMLLPLWNSYSFFVTYANAANFTPTGDRRHSKHPLDVWIRTEVQDLVNRMTEQLENYELSATCSELHDTIDALTNWYIRLSRRRFAGKGMLEAEDSIEDISEESQHEALSTLYDVLITVSQLLAPFCPFVTDAIYLNLVPQDHGSIHLTDWPEVKKLTAAEQKLLKKTRLLRQIVSLGLSARSEQKIKVRQPLSSATVAIPASKAKEIELNDDDRNLLCQELNVKELILTDDPESIAEAFVQVDARKVGPRLGGRVQEIIAMGKRGEFEQEDDGTIIIGDERLTPDEANVIYRGKEGTNVAAQAGVVVSLETTISEELKAEGHMRDLVRAIQKLRKEAGLAYTDRITVQIQGAYPLLEALLPAVLEETRAVAGDTGDAPVEEIALDDETIMLSFQKM